MEVSIQNNLPDHSKVWIYQANRILNEEEVKTAQRFVDEFLVNWKSHGKLLSAAIEIINNLFIVIYADQQHEPPSGCSIDSSVGMIKQIQSELGIDFFDRFVVSYVKEGQIELCKMADFQDKLKSNELSTETLVFNNLVTNIGEMKSSWISPVSNSWHKQLL